MVALCMIAIWEQKVQTVASFDRKADAQQCLLAIEAASAEEFITIVGDDAGR